MMKQLNPRFLPIPCIDHPDLLTTRRRYRRSRSTIPEAIRERIRSRHADGTLLRALAFLSQFAIEVIEPHSMPWRRSPSP